MSQATTSDGEAQLPESDTSDYSHLHGTVGVLSMNGEEIELSYGDVLDVRSALISESWRHSEEGRPISARSVSDLHDRFGLVVGR